MLVMTKHLLSQHSPRLDMCQVSDQETLKTQELDFAKGFSTHNVPTLSRVTRPPEGENRPSVTGQRRGSQGLTVTM